MGILFKYTLNTKHVEMILVQNAEHRAHESIEWNT